MGDFESSKSVITPGVAGSATTTITGTLVSTFGFPGAETALVISLLFGFIGLAEQAVSNYYKVVLYLISSMTIFSVAVGLNQSGMAITQSDQPKVTIERTLDSADNSPSKSDHFFQSWF